MPSDNTHFKEQLDPGPLTDFHRELLEEQVEAEGAGHKSDEPDARSEPDTLVQASAVEALFARCSPDVFTESSRDAVDDYYDAGVALPLDLRMRLIKKSDEALRRRRLVNGPLPLLLQARRLEKDVNIDTVTDAIGVPAEVIRRIERGDTPISRCRPQSLASWVSLLSIPGADALRCLLLTLRPQGTAPPTLAADDELADLTARQRHYYGSFRELLGSPDESSARTRT
jgi:hypothetical protein